MSTADDVDAKPADNPPISTTNDDAIDDSNTTPTPPPTPPIFIQGLSVLSPRQNNSTLLPPQTDDVAVPLPPLRPEEPVASIRGALSEVLGFAHLTRYRLVVERLTEEQIERKERKRKETKQESEVVNGEKKVGSGNCWSPFTLRDAQVTISPSLKSLETGALLPGSPENSNAEEEELVLDEYGDLSALLPLLENDDKAVTNNVVSISSDNSKIILDASHLAIRVVLEKYDLASIRDHMMRVRQLLEGNAPYVTSLLGEEAPVESEEEEEIKVEEIEEKKGDTPEKKEAGEKQQESGEDAETDEEKATKDADKEAEAEAEKQAQMEAIASALPTYAPDYDVLFESATQGGDLTNFYYLACGEEQTLLRLQKDRSDGQAAVNATGEWMEGNDTKENKKKGNGGGGRKKKSKGGKSNSNKGNAMDKEPMVEIERTLYNLNEATRVSSKVTLRLSGYHPPPAHRRVLGDLAYLEATLPDGSIVQVTAFPLGFYANRSTSSKFDPTPAVGSGSKDACYSHALLDCLLQRSKPFRTSWQSALNAAKERSDLLRELSLTEDSLHGIFRPVASTFPNNASGPAATTSGGMGMMMSTSPSTFLPRIDSMVVKPSWLVPLPAVEEGDMVGPQKSTWDHDGLHSLNGSRAEEELTSMFGMDVRGGGLRDWNEELQTAREMPVEIFGERIERARLVHKVLSDFGDASLAGVKAIFDGYIMPMNPNEPARSHVYLHNNIFFSRAVDTGLDTFKIIQGDGAAKKSASRDAHNMGVLHRLDIPGLHTLATVLVEYLGTRIVCQSVVPGILHGEKSHSLLYGAVETLSALQCDEEMHKLLESSIGEGCMVATRTIPAHPLTDERMDVIKKYRITPLPPLEDKENDKDGDEDDKDKLIQICGPMEMKGILGSDKRRYVLDCTRLTPRDANWVGKASGGTGCWGDHASSETTGGAKKTNPVPSSLEDDEWMVCVLRPELVTNYAELKISKYLAEQVAEKRNGESEKVEKESSIADEPSAEPSADKKEEPIKAAEEKEVDVNETKKEAVEEESKTKESLAKIEEDYIRSLRYNVNVFLPYTRSIEPMDEESHEKLKQDEEEARKLARHLWDTVIPNFTKEIRSSSGNGLQLPVDGRSLTELIHQRGINCRYIGRLAELARKEEFDDVIASEKAAAPDNITDKTSAKKKAPRFRMPLCWLELLECEMVARAAKHVLDSYMMEQGGASSTAQVPAQTIASFLSALVSVGEESAAETERRTTSKVQSSVLDQEDMNALTLFGAGGNGGGVSSPIRGRDEIWSDIEREIGRRYRHTLSLYNTSGSKKDGGESRALYTPLLRRICQRSGIRLVAKHYDMGKKCVCGGGSGTSGLTASYPVAPTDILDILPLVKHAASVAGESFAPCSFNGNAGSTSLHVLLSDAKTVYEYGHANLSNGNVAVTLDYSQEASAMYQRVLDSPIHPQISKCLKLTAVAHYHKDEPELAIAAATKYLAVSISLSGFDSAEVLNAHLTMADILLGTGKIPEGVKHLRAAQFLMEFMAGKNYAGISSTYYRMGSHYYDAGKLEDALRFYKVAATRRSEDRMFDCLIARNSAGVLARLGQFKPAFDYEKKAYQLYVTFLGEEHDATKACSNTLIQLMKLAVEQEKRSKIQEKERVKENAADAVADQIRADEEAEEAQPKKKKKQNKKKSKK